MAKYLLIDVEKFMDSIRRKCIIDDSYCEKWLEDYLTEVSMDNPTNGDMIKAMFSVVGFTPLTWHISSDRKEGFHVHIEDCFKGDFRLTVSKDWWNSPYKRGTEDGTEVN